MSATRVLIVIGVALIVCGLLGGLAGGGGDEEDELDEEEARA